MTKKKTIIGLVIAAIIAIIIVAGGKVSASATGGDDEPCIPSDAIPAQHYSWTGGNLPTDQPPTEVPPSDNWQANTSQEPHDNGQGNPATWVNANLHYTANSQGHASWFYFTPEVPAVECPPEQPEDKEFTTMDQKKDCYGIWIRFYDWVQPYVLVEGEWVLGEAVQVSDTGWLRVRELTEEEFEEMQCEEEPQQPDPVVQETSSTSLECGSLTQTVTHVTTTTEYVWSDEMQDWVLGEPVDVTTVTNEPVKNPVPCDKNDHKDPQDSVKHTTTVSVPTSVDAGL